MKLYKKDSREWLGKEEKEQGRKGARSIKNP
jgi:hypothetical protein